LPVFSESVKADIDFSWKAKLAYSAAFKNEEDQIPTTTTLIY
jgi:hypothetical protein